VAEIDFQWAAKLFLSARRRRVELPGDAEAAARGRGD
jgi:hypothetical protein